MLFYFFICMPLIWQIIFLFKIHASVHLSIDVPQLATRVKLPYLKELPVFDITLYCESIALLQWKIGDPCGVIQATFYFYLDLVFNYS